VVQEELLSELWNYAPLLQKYSNELEMYWDEALQDLESNSKDIFYKLFKQFFSYFCKRTNILLLFFV
jgi:hypothetical protein